MQKKALGNTDIKVSVAGFGVLPMGPSQLALPVEQGAAVIRYALKRGFNFLDTAQYYRTYPYIKKALEHEGFDDVVISSKSLCTDYDGMMEAVLEAREELGRDVIDIFLMHELRSGQLEERAGAWDALQDARAKGLVRAIGLSTHHIDVTEAAASMPGAGCGLSADQLRWTGDSKRGCLRFERGNARGHPPLPPGWQGRLFHESLRRRKSHVPLSGSA